MHSHRSGDMKRASPGSIMLFRRNNHSDLRCRCCWVLITCVFYGYYCNASSCTSVGFLWLKVVLQHSPALCRHLPKPGSTLTSVVEPYKSAQLRKDQSRLSCTQCYNRLQIMRAITNENKSKRK